MNKFIIEDELYSYEDIQSDSFILMTKKVKAYDGENGHVESQRKEKQGTRNYNKRYKEEDKKYLLKLDGYNKKPCTVGFKYA